MTWSQVVVLIVLMFCLTNLGLSFISNRFNPENTINENKSSLGILVEYIINKN